MKTNIIKVNIEVGDVPSFLDGSNMSTNVWFSGCDIGCEGCHNSELKISRQKLELQTVKQMLKERREMTNWAVFMGGEPLLRKEWYELGKEVRDRGMKFMIISNGFIANEETFSKLAKLEVYAASVSLDGGTAETHDYIRGVKGSYEKVMNFISLSKKADLPTTVITTVNKLNFKELPIIRDFILNKSIAWQIQACAPKGRFSRELTLSKEEFYTVGAFIASMQKNYSTKEEDEFKRNL